MAIDWLQGYPPASDAARLAGYVRYEQLFTGQHKAAFKVAPSPYAQLRYITANFAGELSRLSADLLFGQEPSFKAVAEGDAGEATQTAIDDIVRRNALHVANYESALGTSFRGDGVFKVRWGTRNAAAKDAKPEAIIEEVPASIYFPEVASNNVRQVNAVTLAWSVRVAVAGKKEPDEYLQVEEHVAGRITNRVFKMEHSRPKVELSLPIGDGLGLPFVGLKPEEDTQLDHIPVYHIPNYRYGGRFWGVSDYDGIEALSEAINNRMTRVDRVLDLHSDPLLVLPRSMADEKGRVDMAKLRSLAHVRFELGEDDPKYVVWDASLTAAYTELERLLETLFIVTETSPSAFGLDRLGVAESGRALRLRLMRTVANIRRKQLYYEAALKGILLTALQYQAAFGNEKGLDLQEPSVTWPDPLPIDQVEAIQNEVQAVTAEITSRRSAIGRLWGEAGADAELEQIDEEAGGRTILTGAAARAGQVAEPAEPAEAPEEPAA